MVDAKTRNALYALHKLTCYACTMVLTSTDTRQTVKLLDCIEWCVITMVRADDWDQQVKERLIRFAVTVPEFAGIVKIYEEGDPLTD